MTNYSAHQTGSRVTELREMQFRTYLSRLQDIHETSGLSLREVAQACDIDHTYVHYILNGNRRPKRDVIICLGFAYRLDRIEVDELLILAGLPPLGRTVLNEFRNESISKQEHLQKHALDA